MGPTDLLKPVIERRLGGEVKFGRVSIKPGKPTTFAIVPVEADGANASALKPLFALPGNPASALVTFNVFVVPALRKLGGWASSEEGCELPRVMVEVSSPIVHRSLVADLFYCAFSAAKPNAFGSQDRVSSCHIAL